MNDLNSEFPKPPCVTGLVFEETPSTVLQVVFHLNNMQFKKIDGG